MLARDILNLSLLPARVWKNRALLWQWTKRQLAMRYAGSYLGYFWTLATPLLMLAVYTFVFGVIFKARWQMLDPTRETTGSFAVILFCGMSMYNIFSEAVMGSTRCVIDNPNLVKKVIFPLELLPIAQTLSAVVMGQLWFALTLAGAIAIGIWPGPAILLFPLALFPLILFSLGLACFAAATTVYLRDFPHITGMALQILFFMTPIFYPESMVPEQFRFVIEYNPITWMVEQGRDLLLFNRIPNLWEIAKLWLVAIGVCQLGFVWFEKVKKGFADVI